MTWRNYVIFTTNMGNNLIMDTQRQRTVVQIYQMPLESRTQREALVRRLEFHLNNNGEQATREPHLVPKHLSNIDSEPTNPIYIRSNKVRNG